MGNHARLSPSGWATWSTCPGSVAAQEGIPSSSSSYADEGTAAHWVLEQVLTDLYVLGEDEVPAGRYLGRQVNTADDGEDPRYVVVGQEMVEAIDTVVAYVRRRVEEMSQGGTFNVQVYAERRVDPAELISSDQSPGTADVTLVGPAEIEVIDLKYGRGVPVEVYDTDTGPNGQLMLYLAGAYAALLNTGRTGERSLICRITVAQPRLDHQDGPVRSWEHTVEDLEEWCNWAAEASRRVTLEPDKRVPSAKGCQWCRAKGGYPAGGISPCKAYADWSFAQFAGPSDFSAASFTDEVIALTQKLGTAAEQNLTDAEIVNLLDSADLIRGLLKEVESWAVEALRTGTAGPALRSRYKLVEGRTTRQWAFEEESTAAALKKIRWKDEATGKSTGLGKRDVYVEKLASPAQIERKLKAVKAGLTPAHWEAFAALVTKPEGAAKLAVIDAPGKDISGERDPEKMFPPDLAAPAAQPTPVTVDDLF